MATKINKSEASSSWLNLWKSQKESVKQVPLQELISFAPTEFSLVTAAGPVIVLMVRNLSSSV